MKTNNEKFSRPEASILVVVIWMVHGTFCPMGQIGSAVWFMKQNGAWNKQIFVPWDILWVTTQDIDKIFVPWTKQQEQIFCLSPGLWPKGFGLRTIHETKWAMKVDPTLCLYPGDNDAVVIF